MLIFVITQSFKNINFVTNTPYVMLWAITGIDSKYERILNKKIYFKKVPEDNKNVT